MTFKIKRGGTFRIEGQLSFDDTPEDITDITIESAVRFRGKDITACATVTKTNSALGKFTLDYGDTSSWKYGSHSLDIKYSISGDVLYSETTIVLVENEQTKGSDCVE